VAKTPRGTDQQRTQQTATLCHDRGNRRKMVSFGRMAKSQDEAKRYQGTDRNGCHDQINFLTPIA
jgi:hypothetical protein